MSYTVSLGLTPTFAIIKFGEDITESFKDRLLSVKFASFKGGGSADTLDLELDDREWRIALPSIGDNSTTLSLSLGYFESALYDCGTFEMDELNLSFPPKSMALHGNSAGMNTDLKAPLITSYDGKTLGDIVGAVAKSAGVRAVIDPELSSIPVPFLNQHSGSGHLLQMLEARYNGLAKFSDGMLSFTKNGSGLSVSGKDLGQATFDPTDISDLRVKLTNASSFSTVRASFWDKYQHKPVWLKSNTPGDPASKVPFMIKRAYATETEAQQAADSQMSALNRKGATGSLTLAKGDPGLRGGQRMTITGTRSGIDGSWIISSAVHSLTKEAGLITMLEFEDEEGAGTEDGG